MEKTYAECMFPTLLFPFMKVFMLTMCINFHSDINHDFSDLELRPSSPSTQWRSSPSPSEYSSYNPFQTGTEQKYIFYISKKYSQNLSPSEIVTVNSASLPCEVLQAVGGGPEQTLLNIIINNINRFSLKKKYYRASQKKSEF